MRFIITGILILVVSGVLKAQSCCSGGTPLTRNLGIQNLDNNEFYVRLSYDYNRLNTLISENKILRNNTRNRTTQSILLQSSYAITERLAVTTLFSLVQEQQETFVINGLSNQVSQKGLGDAFVLFQYGLLNDLRHELLFAAGPKIPLGKTNAKDEQGILLAPDLQPGSGSWDIVAGLSYSQFHVLGIPQLNVNLSSGFKYSGGSMRFEGDEGYRFGNEFISSIGLSKGLLLGKTSLTPSLQLSYRHTQADETKSYDLPSSGGDWFDLSPGVSVGLANSIELLLGADLPFYRNLSGTQLTTSYRVNVGISYRFKKMRK